MGVAKSLRTTGKGHPVAQSAKGPVYKTGLMGNMGVGDVRGTLNSRVITPVGFGAGDEFKLRVKFTATSASGVALPTADTTTIAFTHGTDAAASDFQTALRTATGDSTLTVAGTTNSGPFTVTQVVDPHRADWELEAFAVTGGASVTITAGSNTYYDATGKAASANQTLSAPGTGAGTETPLGYSETTDGTGQEAGIPLVVPTIDSVQAGGTLEVVVTGTEVASGGTSADVTYLIFKTSEPTTPTSGRLAKYPYVSTTVDADGDVTITGLAAGTDYYLVGFTQTAADRVSKPSAKHYFTTAA